MRTVTAGGQNSILATWVKAFGRALDAAGCDGSALLAEAGFELKDFAGPDARCPLAKTEQLWRVALKATGDPAFGVKLAKHFPHTTFHALGYGLSASSTLKEAFERVQRYSHVVSDAMAYRFYASGSEYHFVMEPLTEVRAESVDALVGMYLRMCRSLIGRDFSPLGIELRRPRPAVLDDFERLWRAPLRFNSELNRLRFDRDSMERLLDSANPELARLSDAISARYLARIERHNIEARVRTVLTRRLQQSEPTQDEVAEILNVSARTLQRKLGDCGTSFKEILDETRHALALAYLSEPQ
ncbi:MAG: AraC family transcriptional regulator ligand-binding domain-containing protein, partial [Steroidobacteraceae bacterium]